MIGDLLQRLHQSGELTVEEMSDLLNLAPSSIYRYFTETELRFGQFRALLRQCKSPGARIALLNAVTRGLPVAVTFLSPSLDLDGDGDVDTADAMSGAIAMMREGAALLERVHGLAASNTIDEAEQDKVDGMISQAMQHLLAVQQIVAHRVASQRRRRRARAFTPCTTTGGA